MIIDWCSITIKPDKNASEPYLITLDEVLDSLGLLPIFDNFTDCGAHRHYEHCYRYNNIAIYTTELSELNAQEIKHCNDKAKIKLYYDMGLHIEMSGSSCRQYEALFSKGMDVWHGFFGILRDLQSKGCSLNVTRLDVAKDDKNSILDINEIERCAYTDDFVSLFRSVEDVKSHSKRKRFGDEAKTVYFGNRKSNTSCKFYDKKQEQLNKKNLTDDERLELLLMPSWIRFEMTHKNESAIKVVNAFMELTIDEFSHWYSGYVNSYIRFCSRGDGKTKSTRCELYDWWVSFIGTCERASIKVIGILRSPVESALRYLKHSVAPTFTALGKNIGYDSLISELLESGGEERYKPRHYDIVNGTSELYQNYNDIEKWRRLNPLGGEI